MKPKMRDAKNPGQMLTTQSPAPPWAITLHGASGKPSRDAQNPGQMSKADTPQRDK